MNLYSQECLTTFCKGVVRFSPVKPAIKTLLVRDPVKNGLNALVQGTRPQELVARHYSRYPVPDGHVLVPVLQPPTQPSVLFPRHPGCMMGARGGGVRKSTRAGLRACCAGARFASRSTGNCCHKQTARQRACCRSPARPRGRGKKKRLEKRRGGELSRSSNEHTTDRFGAPVGTGCPLC